MTKSSRTKRARCVGVAVRENYVFDINSRDNDLTNKTGVRKYYRAEKGIVFGAGGFVNDWRMCSLIDPKITKETEGTNHPGATAGALFTLMRAGAIPVHIDYIQWGPWCSPDDKGIGMGADVCDYIKQYGFAIDPKTGRRCFNELGNRTELTNDIFSLKNEDGSQRFAVLIADSQFVPKVSIDRYLSKSLKSGTTKKFETLEELAKFYGLPLKELKDEMAKYNGWIKEGREFDPDFNRPLTPNEGVLMGKGPWYGHRLTSKLHYTMGGARINEKAEVIGQDFKPIPGLYAAGEITGGVHGVTRLGGNSVLDGIVFGRIADPEHHGQVIVRRRSIMKKLVVIAMAALFTAGAYAADVAIPTSAKHKQDCTMCHQDGFKPVPTEKCLTCHADINKGSYTLANGKENPHVSIHYLPETVDCNLCHREHGKSQNYCQACHADGLGFKVP